MAFTKSSLVGLSFSEKRGKEKKGRKGRKNVAVSVLNGGFVTGARTQRERAEGSDG